MPDRYPLYSGEGRRGVGSGSTGLKIRRVLPHARRFKHDGIKVAIDWSGIEPEDLHRLAYLYQQYDMKVEAEEMYIRTLRGYEKACGLDHT